MQVLAIDVVPNRVAESIELVKARGLASQVAVQEASMSAIPAHSESFDVIWCRDMLNHVRDLDSAMQECRRVLRPGGVMMLFQTFAGEMLEPREAGRLYRALGIVSENMSPEHVERAFAKAGFTRLKKDVIASEWREHEVESGNQTSLERLSHAARLLRRRQIFVERYGEARYEQALGDAQWYPFIMLGKLLPIAYLLQKDHVQSKRVESVVARTAGMLKSDEPPLTAEQLRDVAEIVIAEAVVSRSVGKYVIWCD